MPEPQTVEAIYEKGVLRPLTRLASLAERSQVTITIQPGATTAGTLSRFAGILSDSEAAELRHIIEDEFEKIELDAW